MPRKLMLKLSQFGERRGKKKDGHNL